MDGSNFNQYPAENNGLCTAAFVLGIVGFFFNPFYVVVVLAIVFGAIGMNKKPAPANRNQAQIGLILGICALGVQFLVDLIITLCTFGAGFFSFCC